MPTIVKEVYFDIDDIDMDEFTDDDLIEELQSRGYDVYDVVNPGVTTERNNIDGMMEEAVVRYRRGDITETLYNIEKAFPELHGLMLAYLDKK